MRGGWSSRLTSSPASAISSRMEMSTVAQRSVRARQERRLICERMSTGVKNERGTYVDELEGIPYVEEGASGLFKTWVGCEAEDVDAKLEELVDDLGGDAKDVDGGLCDTLGTVGEKR